MEALMRIGVTKYNLGVLFLCMMIFVVFRLPLKTPFERVYYPGEALLFFVLGVALAGYLFIGLLKRKTWPSYEMVLLGVMVGIPLLGAATAAIHYDQPWLYGLASQREYGAILCVIWVSILVRWGLLDWRQVRLALLIMAWGTVLHWLFLYFFVDYSAYAALGGKVSTNQLRGDRLRWERLLTAWGGLYYFILFVRTGRWRDGACAAVFLFYIYIVTLSRSYAVAFTGAAALFILDSARHARGRWVKYALYGSCSAVLIIVLPAVLYPEIMDYVIRAYSSAFKVFFTGERAYEGAADARIRFMAIAMPFIKEHLWLGNGSFSIRWMESGASPLPSLFMPMDIGIWGGLMMYGVIGVLGTLYPYIKGVRLWFPLSNATDPTLLLACKYFIIYFLLRTLSTGFAMMFAAPGLFILMLLFLERHTRPEMPPAKP